MRLNSRAVRVIDEETERVVLVLQSGHGVEYHASDLRKEMGLSGTRRLSIRFYALMKGKYTPPKDGKPYGFDPANPGDYMVLDYVRFEAE